MITSQAAVIRLQLTAQSFARSRRLAIVSRGLIVATLEVTTLKQRLETPAFEVPPGFTFLEMKSLDGTDSPGTDPRPLSVAVFDLGVSGS
jgi:hypothetical protein